MDEESLMDHVTTAAAGAAIVSPWWLDSLHSGAQYLLPFMGCVWLAVQIYYKVKKERK
jgi:hypothetical protein